MGLLGPNGLPISTYKKGKPPKLGEAFGNWAGRDLEYANLPGMSSIQFDLSRLTLGDFRSMRDHFQVNASLSVLSFMQHQSDWHIECKDKKIAEACEENLKDVWTQVNRALSTANWAGFSPNVLQWENDANKTTVNLGKIKDLIPEECGINWKDVEGWAPPGHIKPKFKVYDGIKQIGARWPIPVENSFWFPILMESGDHYGRKLLRSAFQPYFFSILLHLFANRYYERFGEPIPVGRAPFDEDLDPKGDGQLVRGNTFMLSVLSAIRNRSVVVLPNDTTDLGDGKRQYDYTMEYLESQMRGADFERYMTRLDEEISLGIFTPILLMRTADVGSYNLGVGHMQLWLWMLNALNDDRATYINKYILRRMVDYKFSERAPDAKIIFRKLGSKNEETIRAVVTALISGGKAKPDLLELGQMAGMKLTEVKETVAPAPAPGTPPVTDPNADPSKDPATSGDPKAKDNRVARIREKKKTARVASNSAALDQVLTEIYARVEPQIANIFQEQKFYTAKVSMGFKKKFAAAFEVGGDEYADTFYAAMDAWLTDILPAGSAIATVGRFMVLFRRAVEAELDGGRDAS